VHDPARPFGENGRASLIHGMASMHCDESPAPLFDEGFNQVVTETREPDGSLDAGRK